jgi:hypothetical protein
MQLLLRNVASRLGSGGIEEIKEHAWLQDVEWEKILSKKMKAPFRPIVSHVPLRASKRTTSPTKNRFPKTQSLRMRRRCC